MLLRALPSASAQHAGAGASTGLLLGFWLRQREGGCPRSRTRHMERGGWPRLSSQEGPSFFTLEA